MIDVGTEILRMRLFSVVENEWFRNVSDKQINDFIHWAAEGQVFFYPSHELILDAAFKGYVKGLRYERD